MEEKQQNTLKKIKRKSVCVVYKWINEREPSIYTAHTTQYASATDIVNGGSVYVCRESKNEVEDEQKNMVNCGEMTVHLNGSG